MIIINSYIINSCVLMNLKSPQMETYRHDPVFVKINSPCLIIKTSLCHALPETESDMWARTAS